MLSRCDHCHGKKRMIGLGNMERDCAYCKGVGYVKIEPVIVKRKRRTSVEMVADIDKEK